MTDEAMLAFNTITPENLVEAGRMQDEVAANGGVIPPHIPVIRLD
jgi:hypothetical protein